MITTIIPIVIAFLTGITYLAYKHPYVYKKLHLPSGTFGSFVIFIIGTTVWDVSVSYTFKALSKFIDAEKIAEASAAIEKVKFDGKDLLILFIIYFFFWGYLFFLSELPRWLKEEKQEKEQNKIQQL